MTVNRICPKCQKRWKEGTDARWIDIKRCEKCLKEPLTEYGKWKRSQGIK